MIRPSPSFLDSVIISISLEELAQEGKCGKSDITAAVVSIVLLKLTELTMLILNIYLSGLTALMLGRLRMDTNKALECYNLIASTISSPSNKKWPFQDGLFEATTLRNKIEEIVAAKSLGEAMLNESNETSMGRAFVCATPAKNQAHPQRFRSYRVRDSESMNCKIWEAARATTATSTFSKRIQFQEESVDGGLRYNKLIWEL